MLTKAVLPCSVCLNSCDSTDLITAPCEHLHCSDCLTSLFIRATKDETLFPPQCCQQQIPLNMVEHLMSDEETKAFESASVEFTTQDRVYCSKPECAKFIPPAQIQIDTSTAHCVTCETNTCLHCKKLFHTDECPEDTVLNAVLELAKAEGWQRCPTCKAVVELTFGCYHMT
jgi:hypothetical protein